MKSSIKNIEGWKKSLQVEISEKDVTEQKEKVYKEFKKNVQVDGFRKGKVPKHIVEKKFSDSMQADLADKLLNTYFRKAIDENDIKPISPGKINDFSFNDDGSFQFTAEVEVEPEIEIKNYTGLKLEKEISEVSAKDVEDTVELLREQKAEVKPVEKKAQEGDIIETDIQAVDSSGVPIIGEKYVSRSFEIGKPPLGDMLKDQLIDLKPGDEKRLEIPIPKAEKSGDDQINKYLFKIKSVFEKKLPELNEEFINEIGNYQTIEEFKKDIKKKLKEKKENESREKLKNTIKNILIRNNKFDLPPSMVDRTMDYLWEEQKRNNQNLKESEREKFMKSHRPDVIQTLKWNMISDKITKIENITISSEDLQKKIDEIAAASPEEPNKIKTFYKNPDNKRRLKEAMLNEKIMNFIIDNSKVKEIKKKKSNKKSSIITPGQ
ncbi:MAG: trigger factor [bacterium]